MILRQNTNFSTEKTSSFHPQCSACLSLSTMTVSNWSHRLIIPTTIRANAHRAGKARKRIIECVRWFSMAETSRLKLIVRECVCVRHRVPLQSKRAPPMESNEMKAPRGSDIWLEYIFSFASLVRAQFDYLSTSSLQRDLTTTNPVSTLTKDAKKSSKIE